MATEESTTAQKGKDERMLTLLESLSNKFDALREDVDLLKERDAARHDSWSGESDSEVGWRCRRGDRRESLESSAKFAERETPHQSVPVETGSTQPAPILLAFP